MDKTARLWDAATGQPIGPTLTHQGHVTGRGVQPRRQDGLTGSCDGTVRLWDAASGRPIRASRDRIRARSSSVAFSPDGKTLITGSWDKTARLWDAATGRPIGPTLDHPG